MSRIFHLLDDIIFVEVGNGYTSTNSNKVIGSNKTERAFSIGNSKQVKCIQSNSFVLCSW